MGTISEVGRQNEVVNAKPVSFFWLYHHLVRMPFLQFTFRLVKLMRRVDQCRVQVWVFLQKGPIQDRILERPLIVHCSQDRIGIGCL